MKTKEYNKFKFHPANRPVKESNIRKMVDSIESNGVLPNSKVQITNDWVIIDGQTRFHALQRLGLAVPYEFLECANPVKMIIATNANQAPWQIADYIHSHAIEGVDCYRKLLKFEEKWRLGMSNTLDVFILKTANRVKDLKEGKVFDINQDADAIAEFIIGCSDVPFYKTNKFVRSILVLFRKTNPKQREQIKLNILTVPQCSSDKQYLTVYENMLNHYKRSNKIELA